MIRSVNPSNTLLYRPIGRNSELIKHEDNDDSSASSVSSSDCRRSLPSLTSSMPKQKGKKKNLTPERPLPDDFQPSDYTVIIGRGKRIRETTGNCRLRVIATTFLPQYSRNQRNKPMKTILVNKVIEIIKTACNEMNDTRAGKGRSASFVRQTKDGNWFEVDDTVAREKVGYVFRDLLADRYESSSKSKIAKKMKKRMLLEELERGRQQQNRDDKVQIQLQLQNHHMSPSDQFNGLWSDSMQPHQSSCDVTPMPMQMQSEKSRLWQWESNKQKQQSSSLVTASRGGIGDFFADALLNSPLSEF